VRGSAAAIVAAALALSAGVTSAAAQTGGARLDRCAGHDAVATDAVSSLRARVALRCIVNRVRAEHGLQPVHYSRPLTRSARRHSFDMRRRGFFAHTSPTGSTLGSRLRRSGYARGARWWAGETLAWGAGARATPESLVRALLASPTHRAVLLHGRYDDLGIGLALGTPEGGVRAFGGATLTLNFGRRAGRIH
jgi:uncharacterized protein YkwD